MKKGPPYIGNRRNIFHLSELEKRLWQQTDLNFLRCGTYGSTATLPHKTLQSTPISGRRQEEPTPTYLLFGSPIQRNTNAASTSGVTKTSYDPTGRTSWSAKSNLGVVILTRRHGLIPRENVEYAMRWMGFESDNKRIKTLAKQLYEHGECNLPQENRCVRFICFGSEDNSDLKVQLPRVQQIFHTHVIDFLRERFGVGCYNVTRENWGSDIIDFAQLCKCLCNEDLIQWARNPVSKAWIVNLKVFSTTHSPTFLSMNSTPKR